MRETLDLFIFKTSTLDLVVTQNQGYNKKEYIKYMAVFVVTHILYNSILIYSFLAQTSTTVYNLNN